MRRISTLEGHSRMSTQKLLQTIAAAVQAGETDFYIAASGQHDIGGPLWNREGLPLRFTVLNPGQRAGAMCLPGTTVTVEGPAPADVGWLNSGGIIRVRGDAGDTAGHCAASGKIYIGGRAGARSGSLMKRDPDYERPELWILQSTGSFSFEFMSGGVAVVCGHDSQTLPSVLGERPCVGMVGGVVYFRGPCGELPPDVKLEELDDDDIAWLDSGLDEFLDNIARPKLKKELSLWKHWRKLAPAPRGQGNEPLPMSEFRRQRWFANGIFHGILNDDFGVEPLVAAGAQKFSRPVWPEDAPPCRDCQTCLRSCPRGAIKRREEEGAPIYAVNDKRCIGCGICVAVCPAHIWEMRETAS